MTARGGILKNSTKALFLVLALGLLTQCASRPPQQEVEWIHSELQVAEESPLPWAEFRGALLKHVARLSRSQKTLQFGSVHLDPRDLSAALLWCLEQSDKSTAPEKTFFQLLSAHFYTLSPNFTGSKESQFLVTGYYQPEIKASLKPQGELTQPLYKRPPELVSIDMGAFQRVYSGEHHRALPQGLRWRGQVVEGKVVPYHSRREIDQEGKLKGRGLELAFVHPVDAFFLQIQGSGLLSFPGGDSFWVGYADQNGHPYLAVGRRLRDYISAEKMGMEALRQHMAALSPKELEKFLAENPSYVFFEKRATQALGAWGLAPVADRTVAVDPAYFPLGGLGFLNFQEPSGLSRVVLFQDTGGAIKGPRVDLFTGQGDAAGHRAGELKARAQLSALIPRPEFLGTLPRSRP